jgi:hypothetical protein
LYANLKQTVGSNYIEGNIEVGPPNGYDGPFNHEAFSEAVRRYYFGFIGPNARGIRVEPGAQLRAYNITFVAEKSGEIPLP